MNKNAFKEVLNRLGLSCYSFSRKANICEKAVRNMYGGFRPSPKIALRVCETLKGEITLADFGYEICIEEKIRRIGRRLETVKNTLEACGNETMPGGSSFKSNPK